MGVFSRGVPTNQFQVLFTSCIDICLSCYLQVLQVVTRCHLFTSCYTLSLCCHLFTNCYNVLQVHVSPRSEVTFGNDVEHRNCTAKTGLKFILHTTDIVFR